MIIDDIYCTSATFYFFSYFFDEYMTLELLLDFDEIFSYYYYKYNMSRKQNIVADADIMYPDQIFMQSKLMLCRAKKT